MDSAISLFEKCEALYYPTHVVLTPKAGNPYPHSNIYLHKDAATMFPLIGDRLYKAMAKPWLTEGIEMVVGAATGGILVASGIAREFGLHWCDEMFPSAYAEPTNLRVVGGRLKFGRDFSRKIRGKRILIGEDAIDSGGTIIRIAEAVRAAGGIVVGCAAMIKRCHVTAEDLGIDRLECLSDLEGYSVHVWTQDECPLCARHVPLVVEVGKGRNWLRTPQGRAWLAEGGSIFRA